MGVFIRYVTRRAFSTEKTLTELLDKYGFALAVPQEVPQFYLSKKLGVDLDSTSIIEH